MWIMDRVCNGKDMTAEERSWPMSLNHNTVVIKNRQQVECNEYIVVTISSWSHSHKNIFSLNSIILSVYNSPYSVQTSKDSFNTQSNLMTAASCKIRKQYLSKIQWHKQPFPFQYGGMCTLDQGKEPNRRTLNPVALSQTHGPSVSKCLHGSIPATSHTSVSLPLPICISPWQILMLYVSQHLVVSKWN